MRRNLRLVSDKCDVKQVLALPELVEGRSHVGLKVGPLEVVLVVLGTHLGNGLIWFSFMKLQGCLRFYKIFSFLSKMRKVESAAEVGFLFSFSHLVFTFSVFSFQFFGWSEANEATCISERQSVK